MAFALSSTFINFTKKRYEPLEIYVSKDEYPIGQSNIRPYYDSFYDLSLLQKIGCCWLKMKHYATRLFNYLKCSEFKSTTIEFVRLLGLAICFIIDIPLSPLFAISHAVYKLATKFFGEAESF